MGEPAFVHLHGTSEYSTDRPACRIEDAARRAAELGMGALALSDADNLFGAVRHVQACRAHGIKAVLGCRLSVRGGAARPLPLGLLVRNQTGYRNLVRLVSKAHLESPGDETWVELGDLEPHRDGLFCLSGGWGGEVAHWLEKGDLAQARGVPVPRSTTHDPSRVTSACSDARRTS